MMDSDLGATEGCSERLNYLLDEAGFPPEGAGRSAEFSRRFGVSKANTTRWLSQNILPRDLREMDKIAEALGSDAMWWAYAIDRNTPAADAPPPKTVKDFVLAGQCVNEVICYLDDTLSGDIDIDLDDEILTRSYSELYADAKKNKGKISKELVARAAVRVLIEIHRRSSRSY
ncbi:hypothetical protein [Microbulbifer sp. THAF38]|uniref:hypothetical protein n=1 Tax=Microbulbifer sp. THAF38 TaxID=2587856 RepID=UPI0012680790|nr:hypothetical protein [Microbulbifer sp. THAF38]QFT56615.1 hypothetical protein FIU95_18870 [Microbulbifer sp. THAF38]